MLASRLLIAFALLAGAVTAIPAPATAAGPARGTTGDYDGDGDADVVVYRQTTGTWYRKGLTPAVVAWGALGDVPVPGDYNGDRRTDMAVYRPSTGTWYVHGPAAAHLWGISGDMPVPGDYDGDGDTDMAVYRPSTGVWYIKGGSPGAVAWGGLPGDIPVPGDYNGDGRTDVAIYRPALGTWFVHGALLPVVAWGVPGDVPVPADYDGDGRTDMAVYRPALGTWFVLGLLLPTVTTWGTATDVPTPADYNGDGKADVAVFRPSTGTWYIKDSTPATVLWGVAGDTALLQAVPLRPPTETRPENAKANGTVGRPTRPDQFTAAAGFRPYYDRINGAFAGTTEEILAWAAQKWGIDQLGYPDLAKAMAVKESWWLQSRVNTTSGTFGILQLNPKAWPDTEPGRTSTAYNADYAMAVLRYLYDPGSWLGTGTTGNIRNAVAAWECGCGNNGGGAYAQSVFNYLDSKPWLRPGQPPEWF